MFDKMQNAEIISTLTKDFREVGVQLVASENKVFVYIVTFRLIIS